MVRAMLQFAPSGIHVTLNHLASAETIGQAVAIGTVSIYSFAAHRYLTFNRGLRFQILRMVRGSSTSNVDA